jgi:hypothetical protein
MELPGFKPRPCPLTRNAVTFIVLLLLAKCFAGDSYILLAKQ